MPQIPRRDRHALTGDLQKVKLTAIKFPVSVEGKLSTFRAIHAAVQVQVSVLPRQNLVLSAHEWHPIHTKCLYMPLVFPSCPDRTLYYLHINDTIYAQSVYICLFSDDTPAYATVIVQAYIL